MDDSISRHGTRLASSAAREGFIKIVSTKKSSPATSTDRSATAKVREQIYAVFYSPGTFFSESSEREVSAIDPKLALEAGREIVERYGAKPYAFRFVTRLLSEPVPDGRDGFLEVKPKEIAKTGLYHINGKVLSYDEIEEDKERILRSNMRGNDWWFVVETTNVYKSVQPFEKEDVVVALDGNILVRGDDPDLVKYRESRTFIREFTQRRLHPEWYEPEKAKTEQAKAKQS